MIHSSCAAALKRGHDVLPQPVQTSIYLAWHSVYIPLLDNPDHASVKDFRKTSILDDLEHLSDFLYEVLLPVPPWALLLMLPAGRTVLPPCRMLSRMSLSPGRFSAASAALSSGPPTPSKSFAFVGLRRSCISIELFGDGGEGRGLLASGGVDVAALGQRDGAVVARALAADLDLCAGELLLDGLVDAGLGGCSGISSATCGVWGRKGEALLESLAPMACVLRLGSTLCSFFAASELRSTLR